MESDCPPEELKELRKLVESLDGPYKELIFKMAGEKGLAKATEQFLRGLAKLKVEDIEREFLLSGLPEEDWRPLLENLRSWQRGFKKSLRKRHNLSSAS